MAQRINVLVDAGKASAGPPLGPALGPLGVNVTEVIAKINEKTKDFAGMKVPVEVVDVVVTFTEIFLVLYTHHRMVVFHGFRFAPALVQIQRPTEVIQAQWPFQRAIQYERDAHGNEQNDVVEWCEHRLWDELKQTGPIC